MKRPFSRALRGALAAGLAVFVSASVVGTASAAAPECKGRGIPTSKITVQLWTFAEYTSFLTDPVATEEVLRRLSEMGYRNVEPFGDFSDPDLTVEDFAALADKYDLKVPSRHVDVGTPENPADIEQILEDNRLLGTKYFGSGATPIFPEIYATAAEWVAYAEYLDEVGEAARKAGQTLMVHNHDKEFSTFFGDQRVFDILAANTDPRNVVFQLHTYWTVYGGADPIDVLEEYGRRVQLMHVKDMTAEGYPQGQIEIVGEGVLDFASIFAASQGPLQYYVVEHDPRFGDPTFDPFEAAEKGFDYLDCLTF